MNCIELEHKVYTRNQKKPLDLGDVDDSCDEILVTFWLSWQTSANRTLRNNELEPVWWKSGKKRPDFWRAYIEDKLKHVTKRQGKI